MCPGCAEVSAGWLINDIVRLAASSSNGCSVSVTACLPTFVWYWYGCKALSTSTSLVFTLWYGSRRQGPRNWLCEDGVTTGMINLYPTLSMQQTEPLTFDETCITAFIQCLRYTYFILPAIIFHGSVSTHTVYRCIY